MECIVRDRVSLRVTRARVTITRITDGVRGWGVTVRPESVSKVQGLELKWFLRFGVRFTVRVRIWGFQDHAEGPMTTAVVLGKQVSGDEMSYSPRFTVTTAYNTQHSLAKLTGQYASRSPRATMLALRHESKTSCLFARPSAPEQLATATTMSPA